jgi:hypothetical protein
LLLQKRYTKFHGQNYFSKVGENYLDFTGIIPSNKKEQELF